MFTNVTKLYIELEISMKMGLIQLRPPQRAFSSSLHTAAGVFLSGPRESVAQIFFSFFISFQEVD